jgi:hypothetical protein
MGGVEVQRHAFLASALGGLSGQLNAPAVLFPENSRGTQWTEVWLTAKLASKGGKNKNAYTSRKSNHCRPVHS